MHVREHGAPALARGQSFPHTLHRRTGHRQEPGADPLAIQLDDARLAVHQRVERGLKDLGHEAVAVFTERGLIHHEHERLAPPLGTHRSDAEHRELAGELTDDDFESRRAHRLVTVLAAACQAHANTASDRLANRMRKSGGLFLTRCLAQGHERIRRDHDARGRAIEMDVSELQIERYGLGGVESVAHRQLYGFRGDSRAVSNLVLQPLPVASVVDKRTYIGAHVAFLTLAGISLAPASAAADAPHPLYSPGFGTERPHGVPAACSFDEPLCIHASGTVTETQVRDALEVAERAMGLYRALGLPAPMPDARRGGSAAFDLYLSPDASSRAHPDPIPATVGFDRAAAYATVGTEGRGPPCALRSDVARVVAQGMLLAIDGAIQEGLMSAHSSWLAQAAAPCAPLALDAIDRAQQRPDLATTRTPAEHMDGNMLFPWFLDDAYGTSTYGGVLTGLFAVSSQLTPANNAHYVNEPDVYDALRRVTLDREMNLGELLIDYAIARAFVGDRSDGAHLRDVDWLDTLGRVHFQWALGWDDLPKRVAPAYPLDPTGAGYVWLDLAGMPATAEVLIVTDWEETHVFQWAAVRLDEEGREQGRHLFGGTFGHAQAQLTLRDLKETAALLIVGTHVGNDDRSRPWDPESGEPRKAGYTVTVHPQ